MKKIMSGALCALVLAASFVTTAAPAQAATYPYDGQYASSTSCNNDAVTKATANIYSDSFGARVGYVELRYSASCRTTWARLTSLLKYVPGDMGLAYAKIIRNNDGKSYECSIPANVAPPVKCNTKMVNDKNMSSYARGWIDDGNTVNTERTISY